MCVCNRAWARARDTFFCSHIEVKKGIYEEYCTRIHPQSMFCILKLWFVQPNDNNNIKPHYRHQQQQLHPEQKREQERERVIFRCFIEIPCTFACAPYLTINEFFHSHFASSESECLYILLLLLSHFSPFASSHHSHPHQRWISWLGTIEYFEKRKENDERRKNSTQNKGRTKQEKANWTISHRTNT